MNSSVLSGTDRRAWFPQGCGANEDLGKRDTSESRSLSSLKPLEYEVPRTETGSRLRNANVGAGRMDADSQKVTGNTIR